MNFRGQNIQHNPKNQDSFDIQEWHKSSAAPVSPCLSETPASNVCGSQEAQDTYSSLLPQKGYGDI